MMKLAVKGIFYFLLGASIVSCAKVKKTDAEFERENWIAGFKDSVTYYENQLKQIEQQLNTSNERIASLLPDFERVEKKREVTGYYLLKGWQVKIPFTSTGIYARLNDNEEIELIATLAGSTFNQIGVADNTGMIKSEVVPHDQAFNYRHANFNTVYFSGEKADSIAEFINKNVSEKINLEFFEGKVKSKFLLPENEKSMIAKTWQLYATQKEVKNLQKQQWISSKKIETFRRILEEEKSKQ